MGSLILSSSWHCPSKGVGGVPLWPVLPHQPATQAEAGREAKGWVLHYCGGTLRHPLVVHTCTQVVHTCTQVAMHLAQAFGSTSLHKREYLCTHGHVCVCVHMGGGGVWRTQDFL